jgi:simple sugar transport system ATP-binding protein/ribose transport system ATP-binding protein
MTPVVELRRATKAFRGIPAIRAVDFTLMPGEIHALLGENGAGKSTLTKALAGVWPLTEGDLLLDGQRVELKSPSDALQRGIAMVFQETSLVPTMTVAQNIFLGTEKLFNKLRGISIDAKQFLQALNFHVDPGAMVSALGAAQRQMVEIARAVHHQARVIIFDEPTAMLTPEEQKHFFRLVRQLKAQNVAIVFISHALEEALTLSDRITVLRDGEVAATDSTANFTRDRIVEAMVGRKLSPSLYQRQSDRMKRGRPAGRKVLSVQNLSMGNAVRNCSFSVYAGQITGIFGLVGSGRTEMMKIVSGVFKRDLFHGGETRFLERRVRYRGPRGAVRDGIAYVTEDRKQEGFFETMSIGENIYAGHLAIHGQSLSIVRTSQLRKIARQWSDALAIRSIDETARVVELSGGNQQKVVIAKAMVQAPKLVLFDEPTRGVDVVAIDEIHRFINDLADQGVAVVVVSSYLPEIMTLSDRILVCRQGRIVEELDAAEATEQKIIYAAVH